MPELGEAAERAQALVERVAQAIDPDATVAIEETGEEIRATVELDDASLLIGRQGATIDALQHLAVRAAFRGAESRKRLVVDADGYRDRRHAAIVKAAERAAEDALSFERAVEMEPMSAYERRVAHMHLRDRVDVETHSEGDDPERRLVVSPV